MDRRQTGLQRQWLIADHKVDDRLWSLLRKLPRGSGVLVLYRDMRKGERARLLSRLRRLARERGLTIADEAGGEAVRVHNLPELRRALHRRVPMILLSPLRPTSSHPGWRPIARMRAAAYARLARRQLVALGGMNEREFRRIGRLGFRGWAGIDVWLRT